jgi:transposase
MLVDDPLAHPSQDGPDGQKKSLTAGEQNRSDIQQSREAFRLQSKEVDPNRLVFLDECGAKTNMTRLYGRALKGQRLWDHVPHGHWHTTSLISAMRLDGVVASMALDGPTDRLAFDTYVKKLLAPQLYHNDIVVMDNLSAHQSPQALAAIENAGAWVWFLPPYSPDFNPIEQMWAQVKQWLRRARAREFEPLIRAIGEALAHVTPIDCHGFFAGCNYRSNGR